MRRVFDGFDNLTLMLGTSVFYVSALLLVLTSFWLNSLTGIKKSPEFHKRSNLTEQVTLANLNNYLKTFETKIGYGSRVTLSPTIKPEKVVASVLAIMNDKHFAQLAIEFNCSREDCWASFSSTDYQLRELSQLANQRLGMYLDVDNKNYQPLN